MSKVTRKKARGVQRSPVERKEYSYELNGVTLRFVLRQDVNSELKAFKQLLEAALFDVDKDLG